MKHICSNQNQLRQYNAGVTSTNAIVTSVGNHFDRHHSIIYHRKSISSNDRRFDHNKDFLDKEGNVTWLSSAIFKSSCFINVEFFPFDEQVDFPFVVKLILILFLSEMCDEVRKLDL